MIVYQISKLWKLMRNIGINKTLLTATQDFHKENETSIEVIGNLLKEVWMDNKLRQVCSLSPILFKISLYQFLPKWQKQCGLAGLKWITTPGIPYTSPKISYWEQKTKKTSYLFRKPNENLAGLNFIMNTSEYFIIRKSQSEQLDRDGEYL